MPEVSLSTILTILVGIFSAGITWGIMSSKSRNHEEAIKKSESRMDALVTDLKNSVMQLQSIATDLQVMKSSSVRAERDLEKHEERLTALEIAVAKLHGKD